MSSHDPHDEHAALEAAHAHDAHDSHEPHDVLAPEEPRTPLWLTGVGVALLVSAGVGYLLLVDPSEKAASAKDEAPAAAASEPPAQPPGAVSAGPSMRRPMAPAGSGRRGMPNLQHLLPAARPPRPPATP